MADDASPIKALKPATADECRIRIGTPEDVDAVMQIAMMATEENAFVAPNPLRLLNEIWAALNLDHGLVGIIGEPGAPIEGLVLLRIGNIWYSDQNILDEKAIFVHPSYRQAKGGRAARLAEFSKHTADRLGMPLSIGVLSSHRTEAKVRMYSRIMGPSSGAYWIYWPDGVQTVALGPALPHSNGAV